MIIKGRSPTMRHVSRTHRVPLGWLFDRIINLNPQIQIKYVDAKNQLADILTEGSFTRNEWNHLLCFSTLLTIQCVLVVISATLTTLKPCRRGRCKEGKQGGEERVVAKSRLARNPVSRTLNRFTTVPSSNSSQSLGNLTVNCSTLDSLSTGRIVEMDSKKNNASDCQVWHADTDPNFGTVKPVARSKNSNVGQKLFPYNLASLPGSVEFLEKVFTHVRQKLGRPKEDKNGAGQHQRSDLGFLFVIASMKAAVHLGKRFCRKSTYFQEHGILRDQTFHITQKIHP